MAPNWTIFQPEKKEFQEKLSKAQKVYSIMLLYTVKSSISNQEICVSGILPVFLYNELKKCYTLLQLYELRDYWLMTANKMQPELFSDYRLGLFVHFCSFPLWTDNFLTCHIFDFAGGTLGRLFWGKNYFEKSRPWTYSN